MTRCRFCRARAVAVYALDAGCIAAPEDRRQALCVHHALRSTPLGNIDIVKVLDADLLAWIRTWRENASAV